MKTLGELFGSFAQGAEVPAAVAQGVVKKVNILNEVRVVTLWTDFSSPVPREQLLSAEKVFAKMLDASVCIKPHFGAALFSAEYFPHLYTAIKREMPSINGTLNNAEVRLDGDKLIIKLNNGGKALLDAKGFDQALTRLIAEEFDLNLTIKYTGTFEVDAASDEYKQVIQSANKQISREKLEKASGRGGHHGNRGARGSVCYPADSAFLCASSVWQKHPRQDDAHQNPRRRHKGRCRLG